MSDILTVLAGRKALTRVRDQGLDPEMVKVIAGAAGGPKWFVLKHLDRAIFTEWLKDKPGPIFLIGSSIGAWRFAAACRHDTLRGLELFDQAYTNQRYTGKPTPEEISRESVKIQKIFFEDSGVREILSNPRFRLNFMAARCSGPLTGSEKRGLQGLGFAGASFLNLISRDLMGLVFQRTLFYDSRDEPPFFDMDQFPIDRVALTEENLQSALMASGSIPMVMSGVRDIPGAPDGTYRDGGVLDYHMDLPLIKGDGLALLPHYSDRIIPGWLDKRLTWREPDPARLENTILISPSREFVKNLPLGKIPDRNDFLLFKGKDDERIGYWRLVVKESQRLADEFMEATASGRIREMVKPLIEWV